MILLTFLGTEVIVIFGNDELRGKLVSESLWHIIIIDAANILCSRDVVGTFESWFELVVCVTVSQLTTLITSYV